MKRVLITGKNSYIGTALEKWLIKTPTEYKVNTIDLKDATWKDFDFSPYDIVFHVAGLVHKKETKINKKQYFEVNRDLAYATAHKAKKDGVRHFIFLSSMSVYGKDDGVIDRNTPLKPKTAYGKSKLEAEKLIIQLQNESFSIAILRPPMVYGEGCKGNYPKLAKLALITPVFPKVSNQRSMIYIDNLTEFIKLIIEDKARGIFFPQNNKYVNTSEMVELIANVHGKKIWMTNIFSKLLNVLNIKVFQKVFGDLVYDLSMSKYKSHYNVLNFCDTITKTEGKI